MLTCSFVKSILHSKNLWLNFLFLLTPVFFYGQSLTGLWVGSVHNDSATVRKDQSFEIALTEYKGKVYGYSRSEFIVNDTLYFILKRVKGTIEGDICEVTDDEIVSYNFRGKLDKRIRVTSTFRRNKNDSTWYLDGTWKTNANRKYYAVSGKLTLAEEKDLTASKIFPHLEELNKAGDVAFYKERKETPPVVKIARPERINTAYSDKTDILLENKEVTAVHRPELPETNKVPLPAETSLVKKQDEPVVSPALSTSATTPESKPEPVINSSKPVSVDTVSAGRNNLTIVKEIKAKEESVPPGKTMLVAVNTGNPASNPVESNTSTPQPAATAVKNPEMAKANTTPETEEQKQKPANPVPPPKPRPVALVQPVEIKAVENKEKETGGLPSIADKTIISNPAPAPRKETTRDPAALVIKKPSEDPIKKSSVIAGRKSEFSQEVNFKSDSLLLSLYDNGEIDGDTVSVFLNGEVVMPSQGLKSSAIRKTIYMPEGIDSFTLVMFAESLGKYPPNTGLLVIRDGEDVYNLRFSSDFQKSSGIVFRRKR